MREGFELFRRVMMSVSLCGLLAAVFALLARALWMRISPVVRGWNWRRAFVIAPFVAIALIYGGSKPSISFPYTDPKTKYFTDAGSEVRDDSIWLAFTALRIPLSADFHGYYRELVEEGENTNEWVEFLTGTVGAFIDPREIPFPEAKRYEFSFFSTYVEGPTVHTNGVLNVKWGVPTQIRQGIVEAVPIQSEVHLDVNVIATPDHSVDIEVQSESLLNRLMEEADEQ